MSSVIFCNLQNPEKQMQVKALEYQIDRMVYELYGLTEEEIAIVEGSIKRNTGIPACDS